MPETVIEREQILQANVILDIGKPLRVSVDPISKQFHLNAFVISLWISSDGIMREKFCLGKVSSYYKTSVMRASRATEFVKEDRPKALLAGDRSGLQAGKHKPDAKSNAARGRNAPQGLATPNHSA